MEKLTVSNAWENFGGSGRKPALARLAAAGGLAPWQVRKVRAHVDANLGRVIPLGELAEMARLSPSHFSREFARSTGFRPHKFILRQRVWRAKSLMMNTQDSLAQIAHACGFCDQSHFCKVFSQIVGVSPSEWRRYATDRDWPHAEADVVAAEC